jgi:hypothetical protein
VLYLPGDKLTFTTAAEHAVPTPTIDPAWGINTKCDGIPEIHREVQKQTEQMLHDGIIAPSTSPWIFYILVVATDAWGKKKWRIVAYFRKLNDATAGDSFSTPVISEILDTVDDVCFCNISEIKDHHA